MSTESTEFFQRHLKAHNGIVIVPDLLDSYVAEKDAEIERLRTVAWSAIGVGDQKTYPKDSDMYRVLEILVRGLLSPAPVTGAPNICKRDGTPLVTGIALQNEIAYGVPDINGTRPVYQSDSVVMVNCLKCPLCGTSYQIKP